jgi:hypothetical protein
MKIKILHHETIYLLEVPHVHAFHTLIQVMVTALDRVNRALLEYRAKNNIQRWYFASPEALSTILCENEVRNIVSECALQHFLLPDIVRTICNNMRIIFAILIQLRTPQSIQEFIDDGMHDNSLPLEVNGLPHNFLDQQAFFDAQWEFVPYRFAKSHYRRVRDEYVLPIVEEKRLESLDGSFGMISEIKLAPELSSLTAPNQKVSHSFDSRYYENFMLII